MLKNILTVILLGCCLLACGPKISSTPQTKTVSEASLLETIIARDTLKVGTTGDFMPFSYQDDTADGFVGVDIAMAEDLAKFLDVELAFVHTSWPTLMRDLQEGSFDIGMSGITITVDRQKQAFFSVPVYSSGKVAIARDENADKYTSIDKINRKEVRVIFNPGGTNEAFARANFPNATLILNEDNLSIFQKLIDQEADVMVTDAIETMIMERVHTALDAVNPQHPFNAFDFGYLIPKDSILKARIDQWLQARKRAGKVEQLLQKELEKLD